MLHFCEDIFARYDLTDKLVNESAYNHLIVELIGAIRHYLGEKQITF
ncbi:MAG: DUF1896 family protein [Alistipes indistinctus]|nr:DUF1896 family protein [Alistipes indistinctus]